MKKTQIILLAAILSIVGITAFTACNNSTIDKLHDNEAFLVFTSSSRTATQSKVENLKNIVLKGSFEKGDEQTLGEWNTWAEIEGKTIIILAGNWSFTLTAELDETPYYDTVEQEIKAGIKNTVSFELEEGSPANADVNFDVDIDAAEIDYTEKNLNGNYCDVTYKATKDGILFNITSNDDNNLTNVKIGNSIWIEKSNVNSSELSVVMPFVKKGKITDCYIEIIKDGWSDKDVWYISTEDGGIQAGGGYKTIDEICNFDCYNALSYSADNNILKGNGDYQNLVKDNAMYLNDSVHFNFYSLVYPDVDDTDNNKWLWTADAPTSDFFGDGVNLFDLVSKSALNSGLVNEEAKNEDGTYRYGATITYSFKFYNNHIPGIDFDYTGFTFTHTDWINEWSQGKYIQGKYTPVDFYSLEDGTVIWEKKEGEFTVIPEDTDYALPARELIIPGKSFRTENAELTKDNTIRIWGKFNEDVNGCSIILITPNWKEWSLSNKGFIRAPLTYYKIHNYIDIPLSNESDELIADIASNGLKLVAWWSQQQYTKIEIVAPQESKSDSTVLRNIPLNTADNEGSEQTDGWKHYDFDNSISLSGYKYAKAVVSVNQLDADYDKHNLCLNLHDENDEFVNSLNKWNITDEDINEELTIYCELPESGTISSVNYGIIQGDGEQIYSRNTVITIKSLTLTDVAPPDAFGDE